MRVNPRSVKERVFASSTMMEIHEVFLRVSEKGSHMQKRELDGLDSNSSKEVLSSVAERMHGPKLKYFPLVSSLEGEGYSMVFRDEQIFLY